jgi:hypothetical protein
VIAATGQITSQSRQAMSQGVCAAMVSKSLMNPASWGHTATQAPQRMQAFQEISNRTGSLRRMAFRLFCTPIPG